MTMLLSLFKKEWRQNLVIYLLPCLILLIIWIIQRQQPGAISLQLAKILVFTVPIALAGSYGLQAFDLEELGQTRDFLITKPLSVAQVIAAKYLSGLVFLLPLTYLWHLVLVPHRVIWPHFVDLKQFWFIFYLTFIIIIYSGSFVIGALIKGPKKLILAILGSALILIWFALSWFELLTLAYLNIPEFWPELLVQALVFSTTLGLIIFLISFLYQLLYRYLRNLPLIQPHSSQRLFFVGLISIPLLLFALNLISPPVIVPFKSLANTFLADEDWFIAVNGVAYHGDQYALADLEGRLALLSSRGKPQLVYSALATSRKPLTDLAWSPDGQAVTFTENGSIKLYSLTQHKYFSLIQGDTSLWPDYGWRLMVMKKFAPARTKLKIAPSLKLTDHQLLRINLNTGEVGELKGKLALPTGAMAWNASNNQLIMSPNSWYLLTLKFKNKELELISLTPTQAATTPVIATIITPITSHPPLKTGYRLTILSQTKDFQQSHRYNINFYNFNPATNELAWAGQLTRIKLDQYRDLIINDDPLLKLLVSTRRGVYRQIILSKEAGR